MVTLKQLTIEIKDILKAGNIEEYTFESRCIIENIMHLSHSEIVLNPNATVDSDKYSEVKEAALKRITGYPLQYILGTWEFYGIPFYVGEGVLIPRQDTETLVDFVLNYCKNVKQPSKLNCIDLCSGSGCIAVALGLNLPSSCFSAVEYSDNAYSFLTKNISLNNAVNVSAVKGNVLDISVANSFKDLDIIVSNPPYLTAHDMTVLQKEVSFEPSLALEGGSDGLLFYRSIVANWKHSLKQHGLIVFEIGIGQEKDVSDILEDNHFDSITFTKDLNNIVRVVSAVYNQ